MEVEVANETIPAVDFVIQVLVGTFIFSVVLLAAFGLSQLVRWMEWCGAPGWMTHTASWAEWLIFWVDLFCFGLFLASEALKFVVGVAKEWRR